MTVASTRTAPTSRVELTQLVATLSAAAAAYYDTDTLTMSDADYDAGIDLVRACLTTHPEWSDELTDALLGSVAAGQSAGGDVTHPTRMLSMEKADTLEAVDALVAKCSGGVVVEPKMDGLALRVVYRDGRLVQAATRGDGYAGEDVTDRVLRGNGVDGLPMMLSSTWTGEVRGEVFMSAPQFVHAQYLRVQRGGKPFVNPRNATAGALRKAGDENWMPLSFAAYDLSGDGGGHVSRMATAESLGFTTARSLLTDHDLACGPYDYTEAARIAIAKIEEVRTALPFDIDGAVIKADLDTDRATLGEGSRTPHWALAYKYAAEEATAVVEAIEVTVGRTGRMGLRAKITPTFVGGTTVTFATCHNPVWLTEQGIGVGSTVVLKRAGDVIPRITAPLDVTANAHVEAWTPPATCPQCDGAWNTDSLLWRCETPSCGLVNAINYWASRDCLDVEGLGGAVAEAVAETTFAGGRKVTDVAGLYDLSVEEWAGLILGTTTTGGDRTLGTANARKIVTNLIASKSQPFHRVLTGLGIRGTGRSLSRSLAREFPTMDRLRAATAAQLADVEKIGPKKAALIVEQLATLGPAIDKLAARGVNMGVEPTVDDAAGEPPLAGKTVVISGSVPGYTRTTAAEAVEAAGGKSSGSVSAKTSYLVTAETTTSKAKKAAQLGVPVIDPSQFAALLAGDLN